MTADGPEQAEKIEKRCDLEIALQLIRQQIQCRQACCVLAGDTEPHESLLLGTRDGFLNMARVLLEFVVEVEQGHYQEEGDPPHSNALAEVMYRLPSFSNPAIVGMEFFQTHAQLIAELSRLVEPATRERFLHDPQFDDPAA